MMPIPGWKYYHHAALPTTPPHETPNFSPLEDGSIWEIGSGTLLARWTSDFDSGEEGNFWYVIKDTPFDLAALKAKRRYEVNKGIKNFEVKEISPREHMEALYRVQTEALLGYPEHNRPTVSREAFFRDMGREENYVYFGAFSRKTEELQGFLYVLKGEGWIDFKVLKASPSAEREGVNAALVEGLLRYFEVSLQNGIYISDGARSIHHETAFQDYLEKYFGFRKAYCKLHIRYRPGIKPVIGLIYPFRKLLAKLDGIGAIHQINSVLRMEEIARSGGKK